MTPRDGFTPVRICPRDPVLFRDARPFAAEPGARAVTLDWPLPGTVAGALRSHAIGRASGFDGWDAEASARALAIPVHGPLPQRRDAAGAWQTYLPAPRDALIFEQDGTDGITVLVPDERLTEGAGCLHPDGAPAGWVPLKVREEVKPKTDAAFWSLEDVVAWLSTSDPAARTDAKALQERALKRLDTDARTHVAIDPATQTHREGALFTTEALIFPDEPETAMLCRAGTEHLPGGFLPLGGERRLAALESADVTWPEPRVPEAGEIATANGLRLLLVTPAHFTNGWRPTWTENGTPAALQTLAGMDLVAAAVGRRVPVSGWDLQKKQTRATRYLVPAGSVYFFKPRQGTTLTRRLFEELWLQPVSDTADDRWNGYGLAIAGVW